MHRICLTVLRTSFVLFQCALSASTKCSDIPDSTQIVVHELSSVTLDCLCESSEQKVSWKHCNSFIVLRNRLQDHTLGGKYTVLANSSLSIKYVELDIDGLYQCWCNNSYQNTYYLRILEIVQTVPPQVLLSYNEVILTNATYDREEAHQIYVGEETYVEADIQVNVTCLAKGAKPEAILTWSKKGDPIGTVVYSNTSHNSKEPRTFDTTSTLQFTANEENITVTCTSSLNGTDIETLASATFLTYVKPIVFFLVDGKRVSDSVYVRENNNVSVTCYAKEARPAANLTLEGSNITKESFLEPVRNIDSGTFDANLTLTVEVKIDAGIIVSCTSTIIELIENETVSLQLKTYVLTKPVITVNGNVSDTVIVDTDEKVTIVCNASTTKPKPRLTLTRNGEPFRDTKSDISGSSGVIAFFNFLPKDEDIVMCLNYIDQVNITEVAKVTFFINDVTGSSDQDFIITLVLPCTAAIIIIILLVFIVYIAARRCKESKATDLTASLQLALRERPVNGVTNISRDLPSIRQSISPDEDNVEINCDEDKTSTVTDVQMLIQLPGEGTFQYWTAHASFENESSKKIIVKCLSDSVQLKEHFSFRTLADNLKTLKKHRNIIEILGVTITNVPYYIYLEYLEYGTLRDFLLRNYQQSRDSQCNITQNLDERAIQLTGFALDVADGLIYLTDREYCHPALCTRKILLTKIGTCKLYDFWPTTLSTERINQIQQKSHPPVAWLSPETIFLGHYFDKSDVWTFGVTLWEIYSLGETPYSGLTCEEIEQEIRKMRYLEQPLTCPGGLFSMMLASWDKTVDKRPDLSEWKQKLVCLLQSAKQDFDDKNNTQDNGDRSYFTLENNICDYEDDYIEQ